MKKLKVWLVLALVFLAGFVGGVVATRVVVRRVVRAVMAHPELVRVRVERELDRKLRLDSRQRMQVHEVLDHSQAQLKDLRQEFQPRLHLILGEARQSISAVLTPRQQSRFEAYLAEHPLPAGAGDSSSSPQPNAGPSAGPSAADTK
jgi:hypothetical protein